MADAPMHRTQITGVIEDILDDHLGESDPPGRHRLVAESLTESWLKDRGRAVHQALTDNETSLSGGAS